MWQIFTIHDHCHVCLIVLGFVAHDPMVRKLPNRRFVDYSTRNRSQVIHFSKFLAQDNDFPAF